tara:strand:- start:244 stop:966 length:723 start_codon:yes stop_codon:yes gene_type:complete
MKIAEKIELFASRKLVDVKKISVGRLEELDVPRGKYLGNCLFERNVSLSSQAISDDLRVFFGAYSYMNDGGYLRSNVFIGRYCSIGRRVTIGAGKHSMDRLSTSPNIRNGNADPYSAKQKEILGLSSKPRKPVTVLMNDVWVGDGAVIVPGVTIGTGAVIGANAVVLKDVPPYAIVGGCPAKILKYRFPESVIAGLLKTDWWEFSDEQLKSFPTGNVFQLIDFMKDNKEFSPYYFETYRL